MGSYCSPQARHRTTRRLMNGQLIPTNGDPPIPLVKERIVIGRQPDCDIQLPFANVSSRHAELRFDKGSWILIDRKSSNGTKVNDEKIERKRLHPGDHVTFARKYHFKIEYVAEAKLASRDDEDVVLKKKKTSDEVFDVFAQSLLERAGLQKKQDEDFDSSLYSEPEDDSDSRQSLAD